MADEKQGAEGSTKSWDDLKQVESDTPNLAAESSGGQKSWDDLKTDVPEPSSALRRTAGDIGVTALHGAVDIPEALTGLADIPTGGRVGKALQGAGVDFKRTHEILDTAYSPEQQKANAEVQKAEGFLPTLGALAENPSVIAHTIGRSAPAMLGSLGIAKGAMKLAPKLSPLAAGAIGEGAVTAGQNVEQAREQSKTGGLTPEQTAILAGSGALTGGITAGFGRAASRFGVGDINTLGLGGAANAVSRSLPGRVVGQGAMEGAQETLQSGQEQAAQNLATGRPLEEGVGNAAALGLTAGAGMGAPAGVFTGGPTQAATNDQETAEQVLPNEPENAGNTQERGLPPEPAAPTQPEAATQPEIPAQEQPEIPAQEQPEIPAAAEPTPSPAINPATQDFVDKYKARLDLGGIPTTVSPMLRKAAQEVGTYDPSDSPLDVFNKLHDAVYPKIQTPVEQATSDLRDQLDSASVKGVLNRAASTAVDAGITTPQQEAAAQAAIPTEGTEDVANFPTPEAPVVEETPEPVAQTPPSQNIIWQRGSNGSQEPFKSYIAAYNYLNAGNSTLTKTHTIGEVDGGFAIVPKEAENAQQIESPGQTNGGSGEQPGLRETGGDSSIRGTGVPPSGQDQGNIPQNPQEITDVQSQNSTSPETAPKETGKEVTPEHPIDFAISQEHPLLATNEYQPAENPSDNRKAMVNFQDLPIAIENPVNTSREGVDDEGRKWSTKMQDHYGEILSATGADGDAIDAFIPAGLSREQVEAADKAFVVDQVNPETGIFDEHKVILGAKSWDEARKIYSRNYEKGWKGLGAITEMPMPEFKNWLKSGQTKSPANANIPTSENDIAFSRTSEVGDTQTPEAGERTGDRRKNAEFRTESEKRVAERRQVARDYGLNDEEAVKKVVPDEIPDAVTGFAFASDKEATVESARQYVAETGDTAHFIDGDISNLGGLNAHFHNDHSIVNPIFRQITNIFAEEFRKAGTNASFIRHGGDEVSAVIIGSTEDSISKARENTKARVEDLIEGLGLSKIPHGKSKWFGRPGVGIYLGESEITPRDDVEKILKTASSILDSEKTGAKNVRRKATSLFRNITSKGQLASKSGGNPEDSERNLRGEGTAEITRGTREGKQGSGTGIIPGNGHYLNAEAAQASLVANFGSGIDRLVATGVLNFTKGTESWPEGARAALLGGEEAVYLNGKAYIDLNSITIPRLPKVVLHEIGEHFNLKRMLGTSAYNSLQNQISNRAKIQGSLASKVWSDVKKTYPDLEEGSERFVAEVIAKLGEIQPRAAWYRRLLSHIRAFLARHGLAKGFTVGTMTETDLHDLLVASLQSAATGRYLGVAKTYSGETQFSKEREIIGHGNTGEVVKEGNEAVKKATGLEGEVYAALNGVEGVANGYEKNGKIRTPFYSHVISVDTIPYEKRGQLAALIASRSVPRINNAVSALINAGYEYNDPLQFGLNSDKQLDLMDFSNASKGSEEEVLANNLMFLSQFYNQFGLKRQAEAVSQTSEVLQNQLYQSKHGTHDLLGDEYDGVNYKDLTDRLNGNKATNAYYATNARYVQLPGIAQTDNLGKSGVKVILSENPLSAKDISTWELTPVLTSETKKSAIGNSGKINIDGVERSTTDSTGKPIANTEEGVRNFWKWFGDSKVVDSEGKPQAVYHGTGRNYPNTGEPVGGDFTEFSSGYSGKGSKTGAPFGSFFFTDKPDIASSYTVSFQGDFSTKYKDNANVMPVYLTIKNPLKVSAKGENWRYIVYKGQYLDINGLVSLAKESGKYDGVVVSRVVDKGVGSVVSKTATTYVAFHPNQIKSAIGNSGEFNPENPNIQFSRVSKNSAEKDAEYLSAIQRGDDAAAEKMVVDAAVAAGIPVFNEDAVTAYKVRRNSPPVKTQKAYKLFRVKRNSKGEIFALFVGSKDPIPRGVWLDATSGPRAEDSKTGKPKVKSSLGDLAYRPGWHAGDLPLATHIGAKDTEGKVFARKEDEVWAEVEMAADKDYQPEATQNGVTASGEFSDALADIKYMPEDGLYRYKTNANMTGKWIISGSMKINRILSEDEVNHTLTENDTKVMPWANKKKTGWEVGNLDLKKWGLDTDPAVSQKKLLDTVTYDDNGDIIPLSKRFDRTSEDVRFSRVLPESFQEDYSQWSDKVKDHMHNASDKVFSQKLAFLSARQIVEVAKGYLPNIAQYETAMQARRALIDTWLHSANRTTDVWKKIPPIVRRQLASVMHDSTLADVDASKGWNGVERVDGGYKAYTQAQLNVTHQDMLKQKADTKGAMDSGKGYATFRSEADAVAFVHEISAIENLQAEFRAGRFDDPNIGRKDTHSRVAPAFSALPDEAKKVYKDTNQHHTNLFNARIEALNDRVSESIADVATRKQMLADLRLRFEGSSLNWYYAPLSRHGNYWFYGKDAQGKNWFRTFESEAGRQKALEGFEKTGGSITGQGKSFEGMNGLNIQGGSDSFVLEIKKILDEKLPSDQSAQLQDDIYQMYLSTLPDVSVRHSSMHRKGTLGFDEDAMRSFSHAMHHGASQLSNMIYGRKMETILQDAKRAIDISSSTYQKGQAQAEVEAGDLLIAEWENLAEEGRLDQLIEEAPEDSHEQRVLMKAKDLMRRYGKLEDVTDSVMAVEKNRDDLKLILDAAKLITDDKRSKAVDAVVELRRTYDSMVNVGSTAMDQVASYARQMGFIWMLGFGLSSGMVNMLQTPVVAMPVVGAKYGFNKTRAAFGKTAGEFSRIASQVFHKDAAGNYDRRDEDGNASITTLLRDQYALAVQQGNMSRIHQIADEIEAMTIFKEQGDISRTQTFDIIGIGKEGHDHGGAMQDLSKKMGWMFHHGERANREMTLLAAYRLAKEEGMAKGLPEESAHQDAIDYARYANNRAHGDYSSENAARIFRGWPAGIALQFKKYPQMMLYLWGKSASDMLNGWKKLPEGAAREQAKAESKEAARTLGALFTMQVAVAGGFGLPLAGGLTVILNAIGNAVSDDDDEPWDVEREVRVGLTNLGGEKFATGLTKGVFNALTPANVSDRMGLADIVFREPLTELEGRDAATNYLSQIAGPTGGLIGKLFEGAKLLGDGQVMRAAEQAAPKFLGDIVKSARFFSEDARAMNGDKLKDMSSMESLLQLAGFSSSNLEVKYAERGYAKQAEAATNEHRQKVINDIVRARQEGRTPDLGDKNSWNAKHPDWKITGDTIAKSLRARKAAEKAKGDRGYSVNKKMEYLYDAYRLEED